MSNSSLLQIRVSYIFAFVRCFKTGLTELVVVGWSKKGDESAKTDF